MYIVVHLHDSLGIDDIILKTVKKFDIRSAYQMISNTKEVKGWAVKTLKPHTGVSGFDTQFWLLLQIPVNADSDRQWWCSSSQFTSTHVGDLGYVLDPGFCPQPGPSKYKRIQELNQQMGALSVPLSLCHSASERESVCVWGGGWKDCQKPGDLKSN